MEITNLGNLIMNTYLIRTENCCILIMLYKIFGTKN